MSARTYDEQTPPALGLVTAGVRQFLTRGLSAVSEGRAAAGLLIGERGMGQFEAASAAARAALERGLIVVRVSGQHEPLPFGSISRIADTLEIETVGEPPLNLIREIRVALRQRASEGRPVALIIDDASSLPREDQAMLLGLALESRHCARYSLFTCTLSSPGDAELLLEDFNRSRLGEICELNALDLSEVTAYVEQAFPGGAAAPRFVRDILSCTAGRPSYVPALVKHVAALIQAEQAEILTGSRPLESLPLPRILAEQLRAPLATLSESDLLVIHALAVWGGAARLKVLMGLLDTGPRRQVEDSLEALEAIGILDVFGHPGDPEFDFVEPVMRHAVIETMPTLTRRRLHARAAELLEAAEAKAEPRLAQHYVCGAVPVTALRAERIAGAAQTLVDRSRYAAARSLLSEFLSQVDLQSLDAEERHKLVPPAVLVLLAETLSRAGDWRRSGAVLSLITDGPTGIDQRSLPALLRLARDQISQGRGVEAVDLYRKILASAKHLGPSQRARLLVDVGRTEHTTGAWEEAARSSKTALREAVAIEDWVLATEACINRHTMLLTAARPAEALEHSRRGYRFAGRSGDVRMIGRTISGIGNALCDAASLERGSRWLRRAHRVAERCEDYATVSWTGIRLGAAAIESGRWREAEEFATRVVHIDASLHRQRSLARARALLGLTRTLRGEDGDLELLLGSQSDRAVSGSAFEPVARFEHLWASGRREDAANLFEAEYERLKGRAGRERRLIVDILPRLVTASAHLGRTKDAAQASDELARLAAEVGDQFPLAAAEVQRARAEQAALEGQSPVAASLFASAAERFAEIGCRWRRAQALARAGEVLGVQRGELGTGTEYLNEAYREFQRMGARPDLARLRDIYSAIQRRPPVIRDGGVRLTQRELEVAVLARAGRSDAEIAAQLAISRRTVTTHMQRIREKLRIASRHELATRLDEHGTFSAHHHSAAGS